MSEVEREEEFKLGAKNAGIDPFVAYIGSRIIRTCMALSEMGIRSEVDDNLMSIDSKASNITVAGLKFSYGNLITVDEAQQNFGALIDIGVDASPDEIDAHSTPVKQIRQSVITKLKLKAATPEQVKAMLFDSYASETTNSTDAKIIAAYMNAKGVHFDEEDVSKLNQKTYASVLVIQNNSDMVMGLMVGLMERSAVLRENPAWVSVGMRDEDFITELTRLLAAQTAPTYLPHTRDIPTTTTASGDLDFERLAKLGVYITRDG